MCCVDCYSGQGDTQLIEIEVIFPFNLMTSSTPVKIPEIRSVWFNFAEYSEKTLLGLSKTL